VRRAAVDTLGHNHLMLLHAVLGHAHRKGTLTEKIRRGAGVPAPDQAAVPCAGRTLAVKECTAPVWRETLFLYVRDLGKQRLTVHVEHACREPEGRNVLLGCAEAPDLAPLCDGAVHDLHLELQGCAADSPCLVVLISYLSPGNCPAGLHLLQHAGMHACMHWAHARRLRASVLCRWEEGAC
jgi:hypothetical protein